MPDDLSDADRQSIHADIFAGRKIQAIKKYRAATSTDLTVAKNAIEEIERDLRATQSDRFESGPAKSGCVGMLLLLFLPVGGFVWLCV